MGARREISKKHAGEYARACKTAKGVMLHQTARLDEGTITTYSIVTQPAAPHIAAIHDRMPLVIAPSMYASWLDAGEQGSRELVEAAAASSAELVQRVLAALAPKL